MALKDSSGREPIEIVEIDQDFCENTFGVAPCTAALSDECPYKCYNTYGTCWDKTNFTKGSKTLRFTKPNAIIDRDFEAIPSLSNLSASSSQMNPGGLNTSRSPLGTRASCSINLKDHPYSDFLTDPYREGRVDGSAQYGTTRVGPINAANFTASSADKVVIPFKYTTETVLTWEVWFKGSENSRYLISQLHSGGTGMIIQLQKVVDTLFLSIFVGINSIFEITWPNLADKWHHVALTSDGDTFYLYVDGVLMGSSASVLALTWTGVDFVIGNRYDEARAFDGDIAEVRVWDVYRSQQEIIDNMESRLTGTESGLKMYYVFEDQTGSTVTDLTGGYDATISGATWSSLTSNVPDNANNAVIFDGSYNLTGPHYTGFDLTYAATFEGWISTTSNAEQCLFSKGRNDFEVVLNGYNESDGRTYFTVYYASGAVSIDGNYIPLSVVGNYTNGEPFHLAVTIAKYYGFAALYINGFQRDIKHGRPVLPGSATKEFCFGAGVDYLNSFSGKMHDLRVWSSALFSSQIRNNKDKLYNFSNATLKLYYPIDEGSGSTVYNRVNSSADITDTDIVWGILNYEAAIKPTGIFGGVGYDPYTRSTFWKKWLARNKYYVNRPLRIRKGFYGDDLVDMEVRHFIIDKISGPDSNGRISISGNDVFSLADDDKAQAPVLSTGELKLDIDDSQTEDIIINGWATGDYPSGGGTVRIGDELITYTGISISGDDLELTGVTRATDGSEADEHEAEERVQLCLRFTTENCWDIVYDLLTEYAGIDTSFIDYAAWESEGSIWLSSFSISSVISEPTGVSSLISEIAEQCLFDLWWDDIDQLIKLRALRAAVENPIKINDNVNIIKDSVASNTDISKRVSQVWLFYQQRNPTESFTEEDNYKQVRIKVDVDLESDNQYGESKVKKIHARWLSTESQVQDVTTRYLKRFQDGVQYLKLRLDVKDDRISIGSIMDVENNNIVDSNGEVISRRFQVISANNIANSEQIEYNLISYNLGFDSDRLAFWADNAEDDFDDLSGTYPTGAWWSDENGKMSDNTNGWTWQ